MANRDPELFLSQFKNEKIFIDEVQYAPLLFPSLKRRVDLYKRHQKGPLETIVRLTGSNQILIDKNVRESLVGRASYFDLNTLSVAEIFNSPLMPSTSVQEILYKGGWPEIYSNGLNEKKYLDDYFSTYIEKDIVQTAGIQKSHEFLKFTKLLAGRVGQILDLSSFARDCAVDTTTIKSWVSILEVMRIIALVPPYSSNFSKRFIKSPKIYFIDTGLACRLQGWTSATPILSSPLQGHLFENLVFSEIYKTNINFGLDLKIYHWRSRDGEEIDFLIQCQNQKYVFIEAKVSANTEIDLSGFREIKKVFSEKIPEIFICHQVGEHVLNNKIPIQFLRDILLKF